MSTERKSKDRGRWALPLLLALLFLAAVLFAAFRFGPKLIQLINVALKAAVVS